MQNQSRNTIKYLARLCALGVSGLLAACANMGSGPQGGEKDVTPPKYLSSTPEPNAKNVKSKKITLNFDEYIQLKDAYSKVVVSPPQKVQPSISSLGKKVTVELEDSLIPDRTYIIDFANSIADNNEGNELSNYFISFSTGNAIDSFAVSGTVINAQTLAPMTGIYVGAYESAADSAFKKTTMDYIAKTDNNGRFTIRGLKERDYTIYALKDNNNNFMFDNKSEGIAVLGNSIRTSRIEQVKYDTTYKDSVTIDTIVAHKVSKFLPDSLLMRFYTEERHQQYYKNAKWDEKGEFVLNFVNDRKDVPTITPLNFKSNNWYRLETGVTCDTLTYWITDPAVADMDTIRFAMDYFKTDSTEQFVAKRDTISLTAKKWKKDKRYKGPEFSIKKDIEIYEKPVIEWQSPIEKLTTEQMQLQKKVDTLWEDVPYTLETKDNEPRNYTINAAIEEGKTYRLRIDTGKVKDLAGISNKIKLEAQFSMKEKKEYTRLDLIVKNATLPAFVELMNAKESVVRKVKLEGNRVTFDNLNPGDYYARLVEDTDNNGEWTTGNFEKKIEPESTYYYPKKLTLRANWDREEEWDIKAKKITEQRPGDLGAQEDTKKKR